MIRAIPPDNAAALRISSAICQFGSCGRPPVSASSSRTVSIPHSDCKKVLAARRRGETGCTFRIFSVPLSVLSYAGKEIPVQDTRKVTDFIVDCLIFLIGYAII